MWSYERSQVVLILVCNNILLLENFLFTCLIPFYDIHTSINNIIIDYMK